MKVFDCHSDLPCSVVQKRLAGERQIFDRYHADAMRKGEIGAVLSCIWIDPPHASEDPTLRMMEILGEMNAEIAYSAADIERIQTEGKTALLLGMEGLSGLKGRTSFLYALYRLGIRHAMLTWNEENEFATGAGASNTRRGLTTSGKKAIRLMEKLGIVCDVSHANEQTFWDICEIASKPFLASHSNAYGLCSVPRNLKDEQLKKIRDFCGVVGVNAWAEFLHSDKKRQNAEQLANHVDYIVDLIGIDHVGLGFDFCDYLEAESLSFAETAQVCTEGIGNASEVQNFISILQKRGYKEEALRKIAWENILRVLRATI